MGTDPGTEDVDLGGMSFAYADRSGTFPINTIVPAGGVAAWHSGNGEPGDYTFRLMSGNDGAGDPVDAVSFHTDLWTGNEGTHSYQRVPDGTGEWQIAPQTLLALNGSQP